MTVAENLELGGWLASAGERARRLERAFADFPKLAERRRQLAGTMSGGEQQMVAVARAMMSAPRVLLLDEPSLGLAPRMVDEMLRMVRRIADAGTTVLMVEQNVKKALATADRGYVLERGSTRCRGDDGGARRVEPGAPCLPRVRRSGGRTPAAAGRRGCRTGRRDAAGQGRRLSRRAAPRGGG